jgi:hypothetical protein
MPPHTWHLLQALDVTCFSPLERAYGHGIQELARQGVYHIDKIDFLTIYTQIGPCLIVAHNRQNSVFTHNNAVWTTETPRTVAQLEQQAQHVRDLRRHQSQSLTSQATRQLVKGCQLAMHLATILAEESARLRATSQRQQRKRDQRR